jgi:hypothetical protein
VQLGRPPGKVADRLHRTARFHPVAGEAHQPADRHAHVYNVQHRQLIDILLNEVSEPQQDVLALSWREPAPRALERPACRGDRQVDVRGVGLGDLGQDRTRRRVLRAERAT